MVSTTTPIPVVPKIIPVTTGGIEIRYDLLDTQEIRQLKDVFQEVNTLIELIPEEDLNEAAGEDDGWLIYSNDKATLEYAWKKDFLCEFTTTLTTLIDRYGQECSTEVVDQILDIQLTKDYSVNQLSDGLYIVFED